MITSPWRVTVGNYPAPRSYSLRAILSLVVLAALSKSLYADYLEVEIIVDPTSPGCAGCSLSGVGTWNLIVSDRSGDLDGAIPVPPNAGISAFGIPVLGNLTVINRSPRAFLDADTLAEPAGFVLMRSANNQTAITNGYLITGAQDTITPTPYIVKGLGQTASSFAAQFPGHTATSPLTQTVWGAPLLLAEGTYPRDEFRPFIDFSSDQFFVKVLPIPEPSTAALLVIGCVVALVARRR